VPRRQPLSPAPATRRTIVGFALIVTLAALTGCGGSDLPPVAVSPPAPAAAAAQACARLHPALPPKVDDARARATTPTSDLTSAWGDPSVVLRCGVPAPAGLGPMSQLQTVNGVDWFNPGVQSPAAGKLETDGGARVFTTTGRVANIELTVPLGHEPAVGPLVDVAAAIAAQVPLRKK
jgi:hypothetical protein